MRKLFLLFMPFVVAFMWRSVCFARGSQWDTVGISMEYGWKVNGKRLESQWKAEGFSLTFSPYLNDL
ncbi:MAG: hypothetical protein PHC95_07145 [Parabacteroides sp.]|nr:hypothetical protein [Parabacteroides sp.]